MPYSANFHALFLQLQTRYPSSGLVTELLQFQDGWFVVRASIQIQSMAIATGIAAAPSVEAAEDQARLRALSLVGIAPIVSPLEGKTELPSWELPVPAAPSFPTEGDRKRYPPRDTPTNPLASEESPSSNPAPTLSPIVPTPALVQPEPSFNPPPDLFSNGESPAPAVPAIALEPYDPSQYDSSAYETETYEALEAIDPEGDDIAAPSAKSEKPNRKSAKSKRAIAPLPEPSSEPSTDLDDLSSIIALTDVEMDRIGWDKQQGRDYLKTTYGKATRQKLDVDELMDFLNYLRALPSLHGL